MQESFTDNSGKNKRKIIDEEEWDSNTANSEESGEEWAGFIENQIDVINEKLQNMENKLENFGKQLEELRN